MDTLRIILFSVLTWVLSAPASVCAQAAISQKNLQAGYEKIYGGDATGAFEHFRAMSALEPQNLAASFGVLMALYQEGLDQPTRQREFEQRIDQFIQMANARYERNKQDGEALFYLTQGHLHRGRYRVDFDKGMWGAARDGVAAKNHGEAYLKLNPTRADAYVAVGLYNYYVDIAPAFFNFIRFLLFMPKGDRAEGMKQIERTAREGEFWSPFAQNLLVEIYGSLENRFDEALRIAEDLHRRYPENPEYRFDLARLYSAGEVEAYERSAQQYATIIQRVDEKHPHYKPAARYTALLSLARMRQQQWRIEDAIAILSPVIEAAVAEPDWVMPNFMLARGNYRSLLNDPRAADDARKILAEQKWKRWHQAAQNQTRSIQTARQSGESAVYAQLVPANRLVAEHRYDEARKIYDSIRTQPPHDWQVRYRLAYLEFARGDYSLAERDLSYIVANVPPTMPRWLRANAMLHLARVHDLRARRDDATKLYRRVVDEFKNEAAAQAARRGLVAPYRRRET
ncbi:MAG: hypothetical protein HY646_03860 [Acidobacteria bacterium]|nr:hypothetical protein [Acidobacteriota bacterium]